MKTILVKSLRTALLAATLAAVPSLSFALPRSAASLGISGTVPVEIVNSDSSRGSVHAGTGTAAVVYRIGQPDCKLADGSWLYRQFEVDASGAKGTLRLRFEHDRVVEMSMISPATEVALLQGAPNSAQVLVASLSSHR